jgi:PAS domain S-box-containing protein
LQEIPALLTHLDKLTIDRVQRERLTALSGHIDRWLAALEAFTRAARAANVFPATMPATRVEQAREIRAAVRTQTAAMIQDQRALVDARTVGARRLGWGLLAVAGLGAVMGVAGGAATVVLFTVGVSSRVRLLTTAVDRLVRGEPLPPPPTGQDEIGALGQQLHQAAMLLTEREQEAQEAHETIDRFFTLSPDLFCIADFHGYFRRFNGAWHETLGWTDDALKAQPILAFVHPDDRAAAERELGALTQGGATMKYEVRFRCADDTYRWLQWNATSVAQEARLYGAARDITDAKLAEAAHHALTQELEQRNAQMAAVNHELEAFSYSVSHDLRAPLRSIDGFSQVLLEDYADRVDEEGQDALRRVRKAATAMAELIDALLALSRLSRVELRAEAVDLSALATTIAEGLRTSSPNRQVEFVIQPGMIIEADPSLMQALLDNLLANAWKYSQPRALTRIEVGCAEADTETVYFVRDNGVGFDMAYADKLFGAFQRLHRQSEFAGTGVGLATVQRIVNRHGGRVWAEGIVDQGATFSFALPRWSAMSPPLDSNGRIHC